jgi:hypothetical protein
MGKLKHAPPRMQVVDTALVGQAIRLPGAPSNLFLRNLLENKLDR